MAEINVAEHIEQIELNIMSGLKDFQRATVNRIEDLYRAGQMRVLVSDEVGLGKTLIARGTVAKIAKMQKEQGDDLVKVVYICSNASIAEQNLNKLRISSELRTESTGSSRLSMQHLKIFRQENDDELLSRYIQLIPLTPDTSFRMTTGAGTVDERALMFAILRRIPAMVNYEKALEIAMKDWASSAWDVWARAWYEKQVVEVNEQSEGRYLSYMIRKVTEELKVVVEENVTVCDLLISMCKLIEKNGYKRQNNNYVIGKLRVMFAKISLDKLEPDLVIMDEFQRFKYLINSDPESETGMLANKFFNSDKVRMLLLSATPYKMYSTLEEIDEAQVDEHYSEFFDVMNFLNISKEEQEGFKTVWTDYSVKLKELTKGDTTVITAKDAAEDTVDTYNGFRARVSGNKERGTAMRSHFAVAFTKGDGKEKDADRKKSVRNSFNSPFRPFVLASTSIGQEGLDFHNYCRRIVHWNLPSNPIDLEQREGRINRFECLAIRQNIAKRYGNITFKKDIWKEMFCEAQKMENGGKGSDLIPFWGLTEQEDMIKIERIVPMYPFSRDGIAYERLIKILSLYRLTLGQARQEELLEYLFQNCEDVDNMRELFINLSPYYKTDNQH